jgi:hypothetical protein
MILVMPTLWTGTEADGELGGVSALWKGSGHLVGPGIGCGESIGVKGHSVGITKIIELAVLPPSTSLYALLVSSHVRPH